MCCYPSGRDRRRLERGFWSEVERNALVLKTLDYKDIDFQQRKEDYEWGDYNSDSDARIDRRKFIPYTKRPEIHRMRIHFATHPDVDIYSNGPDIPDLQIHLISETGREVSPCWTEIGHISFDWKVLMDRFFGEEAMGRQQRPLGKIQLDQHISISSVAADAAQAPCVDAPMEFSYASRSNSDDCYYITAYRDRLQESFAIAKLEMDLTSIDGTLPDSNAVCIHKHAEWLREAKNWRAIRVGMKILNDLRWANTSLMRHSMTLRTGDMASKRVWTVATTTT
ncbi:hypothetical protein HBH75_131920 [Parastagonospora nodorum]|nr:hypothetical protein HBH75_131920 [Parastagonospora nodorum]